MNKEMSIEQENIKKVDHVEERVNRIGKRLDHIEKKIKWN